MDAYLEYQRKNDVMDQSTGTRFYSIPMDACINHNALVRICKYEFRCGEEDLNEDIWRSHFLQAKECDTTRVAALTKRSHNLKMRTRYDAHLRVDHLKQEFLGMLDELNMVGFDEQKPKLCIKLLSKQFDTPYYNNSCTQSYRRNETDFIGKAYRNSWHGSIHKLKLL